MYTNARIMIVEDERISAEYLKEILMLNHFEVTGIYDTGAEAIKKALQEKPDVIFMDIMLKDHISGSEAAMQISSRLKTKIIFLTSYLDEEMIEYAFDSGAVNYLIKPFIEKQIIAALQIALNLASPNDIQKRASCEWLHGGYCYDYTQHKLLQHGKEVEIGKKSLLVIRYLCEHKGQVVSHKNLAAYVYGKTCRTSALRTLISRLRKIIGSDLIINSSGMGYKILLDPH